jgi:hypothetical protein
VTQFFGGRSRPHSVAGTKRQLRGPTGALDASTHPRRDAHAILMVTTMEVVFALSLAVLSSCHCSAAFVAAAFGWRDWRSAQICARHARTFVNRSAGGPHRPRRRRISATCPDAWPPLRSNTIPHGKGIQRITFAMSAGSILGATLGGLAVAYAPFSS